MGCSHPCCLLVQEQGVKIGDKVMECLLVCELEWCFFILPQWLVEGRLLGRSSRVEAACPLAMRALSIHNNGGAETTLQTVMRWMVPYIQHQWSGMVRIACLFGGMCHQYVDTVTYRHSVTAPQLQACSGGKSAHEHVLPCPHLQGLVASLALWSSDSIFLRWCRWSD